MTDRNPFQIQSSTGLGHPIPLVSEGNHAPAEWALASTRLILNTDELSGDRLIQALQLQARVSALLAAQYDYVIKREIDHLNTFPDHCDSHYDVKEQAEQAVHKIRDIAEGTPWQDLIRGAEWSASAYKTIADHLSSAIHVERLLFADRHADNKAAVEYKRRFTG